jgi:uncharacterized protein YfaA (DUF2138 family)
MTPLRKKIVAALVLVLTATVCVAVYVNHHSAFDGKVNALGIDLYQPDALIRTHSLARLPADLLRLPLARDVLAEEFVDYYERHEDKLALSGALRRIAYEHKLEWPDRLLASVFDEPAEVALWRDRGGRLRYFAVVMTRNTLARAIQMVVPVLPDTQISTAGKLPGTEVEILVLEYGVDRRLLLLAQGDRVVALSDPGMLLSAPGEDGKPQVAGAAAEIVSALLQPPKTPPTARFPGPISPFAQRFKLNAPLPEKQHELILGSGVFSLGYDVFAPDLAALDLRFDPEGNWQSAVLLERNLETAPLAAAPLWAALPHGASLCAALPVDWARLAPPLATLNQAAVERDGKPLVSEATFITQFADTAAVCWYGEADLFSPLFAASLKATPNAGGRAEFFALAKAATQNAEDAKVQEEGQTALWRKDGKPENGGAALAISGAQVFFSPDAALLEKTLDVAKKRYPALADRFAADDADDTLAVIEPRMLAELLQREIFAALPRNEEALFRNAADVYLAPRLEALSRYPVTRIRLGEVSGIGGLGGNWRTLKWETQGAPDRASESK